MTEPLDVRAVLNRARANELTEADAVALQRVLCPTRRQRLEDAAEYLLARQPVVRAWLPYDVRRKLADVLIGEDGPEWRCDMDAPNQDIGAPETREGE